MNIKKSDWVKCKNTSNVLGIVTRAAKDKTWADVKWNNGINKRMDTKVLEVCHTISAFGYMVTDITREKELERSIQ